MKIRNNKKGLTLIELLSTVALLAVVSTVTVAIVLPRMENSKKSKFLTDTSYILKTAEELFVAEDVDNDINLPGTTQNILLSGNIHKYKFVNITNFKKYINNIDSNNYQGYVVFSLDDDDYGKGYINITNGKYYLSYTNNCLIESSAKSRCAISMVNLDVDYVKKYTGNNSLSASTSFTSYYFK
ncbi:MAG: prepilin-type N-terminal cleavage/methylation domain-containing protein [Bacilli bacterium]|nr:prepilin-type N-terminal cleavage/methylation domain-containing protein [Bacilli bacterium]